MSDTYRYREMEKGYEINENRGEIRETREERTYKREERRETI